VPALAAALLCQVAILEVVPHDLVARPVLVVAHLMSYAAAGAFLVANRAIPGLWILGAGGLANLTAIAANGGVMPATPAALRSAGLSATGAFSNSAAVEGARLAWLGDVFAIPAALPLANVFSVGDIVVVIGATVMLNRLCRATDRGYDGIGSLEEDREEDIVRQTRGADGDWTLVVTPELDEARRLSRSFSTSARPVTRARGTTDVLELIEELRPPTYVVFGPSLPAAERAAMRQGMRERSDWWDVSVVEVSQAETGDAVQRPFRRLAVA
jgi:hypothetical protein